MRHISRKIIAMSMGIMMAGSAVCHISVQTSIVAEAHSGRTDASGGHRDNKNKSGLGSYHYHCGGHPAHLHTDGVCPYAAASSGSTQTTTSAPASEADTELTKQVQQALNDKGYDCGTPDGITGEKTRTALIKFQEDNNLTADGIIGEEVKTALGI
ncbi:peptidoglycan-binding protein [Enterocloster aldenensis]|uniref:peptidoglycan-binding protein n=1 Tax=Enterocloster aldenensis TaxID=358742 RepID=UPI0025A43F13|nr:peptidoglycan-binding protein [Enterocloster aldenensis]